jgi:hypothetical protein
MVWYGSPEYNARLKAAAKRIALDHILEELLIEVARLHDSPVESLNELQARVHSRFALDANPNNHEMHVQTEAAQFTDAYFETARKSLKGIGSPGGEQPDPGPATSAAE